MRTDEETDMTKLISAYRNITNAPKTSRSRNVFWFQVLDLVTFITTQKGICIYVIHTYFSVPLRSFCMFLQYVHSCMLQCDAHEKTEYFKDV
jgi:hypothetical protein